MKRYDFYIEDMEYFDPKTIADSGQAFRFTHLGDGVYRNIAKGQVITMKREKNRLYFQGLDREEFENQWSRYFDCHRDYEAMRQFLGKDPLMKKALDYGWGIRLLNQEIFETLITFIISANSHIPRIKASVEKMASFYGKPLKGGQFAFPSPKTLAKVSPEELRNLVKVGYRDRYIVETAKMVATEEVDLETIKELDLSKARKVLMTLPGVGEKVADCILLFAYERKESFPVDVWIKRVMEDIYLKEEVTKREVATRGRQIFGNYAGYANQYLFYYGRDHQLGKKR